MGLSLSPKSAVQEPACSYILLCRAPEEDEKLRTVDIASDCAIEVDRHLVRGVSSLPGAHLVDLYLGLHEYQSHGCVSHEAREAGNTPEHLRGT